MLNPQRSLVWWVSSYSATLRGLPQNLVWATWMHGSILSIISGSSCWWSTGVGGIFLALLVLGTMWASFKWWNPTIPLWPQCTNLITASSKLADHVTKLESPPTGFFCMSSMYLDDLYRSPFNRALGNLPHGYKTDKSAAVSLYHWNYS